jgi:CDP-diacylglycerol--glycerol-3-phosphate 3-phosphatidyltransferase
MIQLSIILQVTRFFLLVPALYLVTQNYSIEPAILMGIAFLIGLWQFFLTKDSILNSPYRNLALRTANMIFVAILAGTLLYREFILEDTEIPKMLIAGTIVFSLRAILYPIFGIYLVKNRKELYEGSYWSKLGRLSVFISLAIYILKIEYYNQIFMGISLLLHFAGGIAFVYRFYRDPEHRKPLNIASQITVSRIVLTPVFILVFIYDNDMLYQNNHIIFKSLAFLMVVLFMVTDYLDGYLARKMNQVSTLGKLLDPFSDKIANMTIFLCFMTSNYAHIYMVAAIYFREASVETLRTLAASKGYILDARQSGKYKTAIQGTGILVILMMGILADFFPNYSSLLNHIPLWIMGFVTLATLLSGFDYFYANRKLLAEFL